jgi:hypothetical protein
MPFLNGEDRVLSREMKTSRIMKGLAGGPEFT